MPKSLSLNDRNGGHRFDVGDLGARHPDAEKGQNIPLQL